MVLSTVKGNCYILRLALSHRQDIVSTNARFMSVCVPLMDPCGSYPHKNSG